MRVVQGTQHQRTALCVTELWDFSEHRFQEYDPSRADERWRALTPRVVKGQASLLHLKNFYTRWQRLSNETRSHVIREQLRNELPWIKEKVLVKDAKNSPISCVVGFSGLDRSPGRAAFEN